MIPLRDYWFILYLFRTKYIFIVDLDLLLFMHSSQRGNKALCNM